MFIKTDKLNEAAQSLNYKKTDDLYASLGRGDIKIGQIVNRITPSETPDATVLKFVKTQQKPRNS